MGKFQRLAFVTGITGTLFVTLFACSSSSSNGGGGGISCSSKGPCANDPTPTSDQVTACQKAQADTSCGSQYTAFGNCAVSNSKCGADGKTDGAAVLAACSSQFQAYESCALAHMDAGGGG